MTTSYSPIIKLLGVNGGICRNSTDDPASLPNIARALALFQGTEPYEEPCYYEASALRRELTLCHYATGAFSLGLWGRG